MKEKKYLIITLSIVLLTLVGTTYAYFSSVIVGDKKNITVDMAELKIIFTNGDAIEASDVYAEDNLDIVKTFSVENKTRNEYKYNIVIEDLVNTFKTTGYISLSKFSENGNDPMYVGYMYGTNGSLENNRTNTNDSTIKTVIYAWYENNLLTNYDKYVSKTAIYCNDKSTQNNSYVIDDSFVYSGITRLYSSDAPSYKCGANTNNGLFEDTQAVEDKFSASTTGGGNGQLKYPMALMTADEVTFAGGVYNLLLSSPYA